MVIHANNKNIKIFVCLRNIKATKDYYKYIGFLKGNFKYFYVIFFLKKK